jgi:hypothetical protein
MTAALSRSSLIIARSFRERATRPAPRNPARTYGTDSATDTAAMSRAEPVS